MERGTGRIVGHCKGIVFAFLVFFALLKATRITRTRDNLGVGDLSRIASGTGRNTSAVLSMTGCVLTTMLNVTLIFIVCSLTAGGPRTGRCLLN